VEQKGKTSRKQEEENKASSHHGILHRDGSALEKTFSL
jgi:hypothetical protein